MFFLHFNSNCFQSHSALPVIPHQLVNDNDLNPSRAGKDGGEPESLPDF